MRIGYGGIRHETNTFSTVPTDVAKFKQLLYGEKEEVTIQNTGVIFKNLAKLKKTDVELHLVDVIGPEEYKGMSTVEISDCVYERMIADLGESFRAE